MAERRQLTAVLAVLALPACTAVPSTTGPGALPPPRSAPPASAYGRPGALVGADAKRLIKMFGTPRLDIRDPAVRKLQFANGRCVLDAYLYSPARGKEPVVTHVDARLANGADTDSTGCVAALQGR